MLDCGSGLRVPRWQDGASAWLGSAAGVVKPQKTGGLPLKKLELFAADFRDAAIVPEIGFLATSPVALVL
ncbi:MAG: hypothetical protein ACLQU1_37455 [Bryobacteraceae bacterium]